MAIHVLLKIRSIISSFPGGEGNKGMINASYGERVSVFYELVLNFNK